MTKFVFPRRNTSRKWGFTIKDTTGMDIVVLAGLLAEVIVLMDWIIFT